MAMPPLSSGKMLRTVLFILSLLVSQAANADYKVKYERVVDAVNHMSNGEVYRISIKAGDRLLHSEETTLIPGCRETPAITYNKGGVVVVCGNTGGNHYTFYLVDIRTGARHHFDGGQITPSFIATQKALNFKYITERIFDGKIGYFPYSYSYDLRKKRLSLDYGGEGAASNFYTQHYRMLMSGEFRFNSTPAPMIAALLYSGNKSYICEQLAILGRPPYRLALTDISQLIKKLNSVGYVKASLNLCD